ncbi:MAG: diacylglycerol kinase [Patescibacteria group bacterium]
MPHDLLQSARHAIAGFLRAWRGERNVRLFLLGYVFVLFLGLLLDLSKGEWFALLITGGMFLSVELLNTSIEYVADIVDDHLKAAHCTHNFEDMKMVKDVAAAASLVSFLIVAGTVVAIFVPHISKVLGDRF